MATILVKLTQSGQLDVPDLEIQRPSLDELITWKLDDATVPPDMKLTSSSIKWIKKAPWNVISWPPELSLDKRQMTLIDDHRGSGTVGVFIYQLVVEKVLENGVRQHFSTTKVDEQRTSDLRMLSNNPVIINR